MILQGRAGTAEEIWVYTCGDPLCDSHVAKCTNPHCGGWHVARNPSRFFDEVRKCERAYQRSQEVKVQQISIGMEECQPKAELGPLTPGQVPMAKFHEVTPDVVAPDRGSGECPMGSYGLPVMRSGLFDEAVDAGCAEGGALCLGALQCLAAAHDQLCGFAWAFRISPLDIAHCAWSRSSLAPGMASMPRPPRL